VVTGSLTIGAPPSFAAKWLIPRLPRLGEACPEIEVRIVCASELVNFGSHRRRNPPRQRRISWLALGPVDDDRVLPGMQPGARRRDEWRSGAVKS
jgi:LysR family glycine cleavage system transcriptional activator